MPVEEGIRVPTGRVLFGAFTCGYSAVELEPCRGPVATGISERQECLDLSELLGHRIDLEPKAFQGVDTEDLRITLVGKNH